MEFAKKNHYPKSWKA